PALLVARASGATGAVARIARVRAPEPVGDQEAATVVAADGHARAPGLGRAVRVRLAVRGEALPLGVAEGARGRADLVLRAAGVAAAGVADADVAAGERAAAEADGG